MSNDLSAFDAAASHWIRLVGTCIEIFGVFILVAGIAWSTYRYVGWPTAHHYDQYRIRIGRSLLLGLEVLVAADIVKTVAIDLTFASLGLLAWAGTGAHLPELDAGARNRGSLAVAATTRVCGRRCRSRKIRGRPERVMTLATLLGGEGTEARGRKTLSGRRHA